MAKQRITMLTTYASPDLILHEGKSYAIDSELAERLKAVGAGEFPTETAAVVADRNAKLTRVDAQPDPGDKLDAEVEDDDDADAV